MGFIMFIKWMGKVGVVWGGIMKEEVIWYLRVIISILVLLKVLESVARDYLDYGIYR